MNDNMNDRLYRSREKRVVAGVAGGLAEYMNIDPILVRIVFIIITFLNGIGVLLYLVMWIVIPERELIMNYSSTAGKSTNDTNNTNEGEAFSGGGQEEFDPVKFFNERKQRRSYNGRITAGVILTLLGIIFLAERFLPNLDLLDFLPLLLILLGVFILWNSIKNNKIKQ